MVYFDLNYVEPGLHALHIPQHKFPVSCIESVQIRQEYRVRNGQLLVTLQAFD